MSGAVIAASALACLGVPFRLHGRHTSEALDCIGLVGTAIRAVIPKVIIPSEYSLRGSFIETISTFFKSHPFLSCMDNTPYEAGDILVVTPAARQAHLLIWTQDGFVHAHAGLRRTVFTPGLPEWPIAGRWRYKGN
jgi:murein DD-endopeptidase / murein LD-carboxypeptidase